MSDPPRITAVLGPTNTGKTHYAVERMLGHGTGVIGLPLRLLAREVYDRIVAARGPSTVALVTGEERIVPPRTRYWVCTVEAMPVGFDVDFLAVDEIQLCADPERGHVFTDRLLHARGRHETVFLGSENMRGAIASLVPRARFERRERFSTLTHTGVKKISRMPPRSAIVGFSVENLYAIAELLRRQKGGAAVVMGALSPRTRNAQVEIYQNGDVDYLVATDAIGMGLNLDIRHVAFSATAKFDGRRMRQLQPNELAQIAGRAGRHERPGTYGVTGEAKPLANEVVEAIGESRFAPVRKLQWRNSRLEFGTVDALVRSLEAPTDDALLTRARESEDLLALKAVADAPEVVQRVGGGGDVRLLWDVCRIPDFRGISADEHAALLRSIFVHLRDSGHVPDDWLAGQVRRIDRTEGDIDTLSKRLAHIRTWTYVAQRKGWVADADHWRGETRAVEDRLSDALHDALTRRFVDRRTGVLVRRLKQKEGLLAEVNDKGEVTVEGEFVGRLEGFRFRRDKASDPGEDKALRQASVAALAPQFSLRADRFYNASDTEMDFTDQGGLMWGTDAVGKIARGADPMNPGVEAFVDDEAGPDVKIKVERRLRHFVDRKVAALFEPLEAMRKDETIDGLARGFSFRLIENLGIIKRDEVASEVKDLDQGARGALRKHGVRFGQFTIFMPALLKPAPTRLRLVLWAVANGFDDFPESPPPGLVTIPVAPGVADGTYMMSGYRRSGQRAIRIDMLERLADLIRAKDTRTGFEASAAMLSLSGLTLDQFADLMRGLGYSGERGEREKVKEAPAEAGRDARTANSKEGTDSGAPASEPAAAIGGGSNADPPGGDSDAGSAAPPDGSGGESPEDDPEETGSAPTNPSAGAPADAESNEGALAPPDGQEVAEPDSTSTAAPGAEPDSESADSPADGSTAASGAEFGDGAGVSSSGSAGGSPDCQEAAEPDSTSTDSPLDSVADGSDADGGTSSDGSTGVPPDVEAAASPEAAAGTVGPPTDGVEGIGTAPDGGAAAAAGGARANPPDAESSVGGETPGGAGTGGRGKADAEPEMEVFYVFRRDRRRRGGARSGPRRDGQSAGDARNEGGDRGAARGGDGRRSGRVEGAAARNDRGEGGRRNGRSEGGPRNERNERGEGGRRHGRSEGGGRSGRGEGGRRNERGEGGWPKERGGGRNSKGGGGDRERGKGGPRIYSSKPEADKDRIDPDNPFAAALMGLKDRK